MPMTNRGLPAVDVWLAVFAGPLPWIDGRLPASHRLLLLAEVWMGVGLVLMTVAVRSVGVQDPSEIVGFTLTSAVAMAALLLPSALAIQAAPWRPGPVALAVVRAIGMAAMLFLLVREFGGLQPTAVMAFGILAGAETAVSLRTIGLPTGVPVMVRRFLLSSVHLGMLCGFAAVVVVSREGLLDGALTGLMATLYTVSLVGIVTGSSFARALDQVDVAAAAREHEARISVHREQAHWLHDDVCSRLSNARQRLEAGTVDLDEVMVLIDDLDHHLRLRQVEGILDGGPVRLVEIVQPYIRLAQKNRVRVVETPPVETASTTVDSRAGKLIQRACAVLVANAIQAGATELRINATRRGEPEAVVEIEIEDDAGGFDVGAVVPGRGLDSLRRDLGSTGLTLTRTALGTRATVSVRLAGEPARWH